MPEKLYITPSQDPAFNLALEEILLGAGEDCILLWRSRPAVLIGVHQIMAAEVRSVQAGLAGIPVLRRTTGGGTVYIDPGTLAFSIFTAAGPWSPERAKTLLQPILIPLKKRYPDCFLSGRNDILCRDRKISGCARRTLRNRMMLHGTLLYDADLDALAGLLTPEPVKLRAKGIASVRARVGNLRAMAADAPDTDAFAREMLAGIMQATGLPPPEFPAPEMLDAANKTARSRYGSREWNCGTAFPCTFSRTGHFPGGHVTAETDVRNHRITAVRFTGDFFAERPLEELAAALTGIPPEAEAAVQALQAAGSGFIAGVTDRQLAELLVLNLPPPDAAHRSPQ